MQYSKNVSRLFKKHESKHIYDRAERLAIDMLQSWAYRGLSPYAKTLLIELKRKTVLEPDHPLIYTRSEAKEMMDERTFIKARDQLVQEGFIDIVEDNSEIRKPHIYTFSDRWKSMSQNISRFQ